MGVALPHLSFPLAIGAGRDCELLDAPRPSELGKALELLEWLAVVSIFSRRRVTCSRCGKWM